MDEQQQSDVMEQLRQLDAREERLMVERQQLNAKAEWCRRWGAICACLLSALAVSGLLYMIGRKLGWWG